MISIIPRAWTPYLLAVLRIATALLFLQHGFAKLFHWPHVAMFDNLKLFSMMGLAGVLELVGGALLLIGFLNSPGRLHFIGRNGRRLFHGPCNKVILADPQSRGVGGAVLLCFSVPCGGGSRPFFG